MLCIHAVLVRVVQVQNVIKESIKTNRKIPNCIENYHKKSIFLYLHCKAATPEIAKIRPSENRKRTLIRE